MSHDHLQFHGLHDAHAGATLLGYGACLAFAAGTWLKAHGDEMMGHFAMTISVLIGLAKLYDWVVEKAHSRAGKGPR